MTVSVCYYLDVTSSWCYWAEPAWLELWRHYSGAAVEFNWKIALLDETGQSKSRSQLEWFYRRSGTIVHSPFMLNAGWFEQGWKEYPAPNCVAEAAKEFGVPDDRVRLALAEAGLREGQRIGQWEIAAAIAAKAAALDGAALLARARSSEVEQHVRKSTAEFHALKVTQRPAFVIESVIGDRAVFSGLVKAGPIEAAIDAMLEDAAAYASHAAHFGPTPTH